MSTNTHSGQEGNAQLADLEERDVRALTEYLTVLADGDRADGAADLFLVVSGSNGDEYLVDARHGRCECPDHEYRNTRCKHIRRVAFETGEQPVPAAYKDELPSDFSAHVDGEPRFVATDGGQLKANEGDEGARWSKHREPAAQGGELYWRCEGCRIEVLCSIGREGLRHREGCPNG